MGVKGKLIFSMEVKCGGYSFHDIFHNKTHHIPKMSPSTFHHFEIHEGEIIKIGSIVGWKYIQETMFRRFSWNGDIQAKGKALIPWDKMCLAKTTGGLNITDLYLRGQFPKVNWRKVHCNNQGHPKWRFIMFVVIHQRLYTKDRLDKWGIHPSRMCALCEEELEDHQHLFFKCSVSWAIWKRMLLAWQGITRRNMGWTDEIQWISTHAKGKHLRAAILRMSFVATVYHIWLERNQRTFQQKKRTIDTLIKRIIQDIHFRATIYPKLTDGKEMFLKEVVDAIDRDQSVFSRKVIEGNMLELYSSFTLVTSYEHHWTTLTLVYEKKTEDTPEPITFLSLLINMAKDMEGHLLNQ
ncbi:hypothetical protein P3S68_024072 [Capsicum galapagoense]